MRGGDPPRGGGFPEPLACWQRFQVALEGSRWLWKVPDRAGRFQIALERRQCTWPIYGPVSLTLGRLSPAPALPQRTALCRLGWRCQYSSPYSRSWPPSASVRPVRVWGCTDGHTGSLPVCIVFSFPEPPPDPCLSRTPPGPGLSLPGVHMGAVSLALQSPSLSGRHPPASPSFRGLSRDGPVSFAHLGPVRSGLVMFRQATRSKDVVKRQKSGDRSPHGSARPRRRDAAQARRGPCSGRGGLRAAGAACTTAAQPHDGAQPQCPASQCSEMVQAYYPQLCLAVRISGSRRFRREKLPPPPRSMMLGPSFLCRSSSEIRGSRMDSGSGTYGRKSSEEFLSRAGPTRFID